MKVFIDGIISDIALVIGYTVSPSEAIAGGNCGTLSK